MGSDSFKLKPLSSVSLYLHVPFCRVKCGYCDFFSVPACDREMMESIINGIQEQFQFYFELLGFPEIRTLYIGGGTPNFLPPALFEKLLSWLSCRMGKNCVEWTVELNPERITPEQVRFLSEISVTRLSLGVQSFDEKLLRILKRNAAPEETLRGLEIVSELWEGDTNIDLMTSIPGETVCEAQGDVRKAISYGPEHISCYALTLEKGTPLYRTFAHEPENIDAWESSVETLSNNGYNRYEISNFSLPGNESLHNLSYWRMKPYLGIGPAAVSTLPSEEGIIRLHNPHDLPAFKSLKHNNAGVPSEKVVPKQFLFEYCMMGLRLADGLDSNCFTDIFGRPPSLFFPETLTKWVMEGNAAYDNQSLRLTNRGLEILNVLLVELLSELEKSPEPRVRWPLRGTSGLCKPVIDLRKVI